MLKIPKWTYDEMKQTGVDYSSVEQVRRYDGGFLTYNHDAEPADAMVSIAALHHLPDFWKSVALRRAAAMLKVGGRFFLFDIVFPSEAADLEDQINAWVRSTALQSGPELAVEAEIHIIEEYSTYDWIMEGLLERVGFKIESAEYGDGFQATYVCQ
ncbi:MAG: class I SAM-dependent methyltransferase [Euryarchaeota archaeon]|nr:class I SAM-dependent methyltransferase [Euryarchaeota archaeon]